jgi:hypothetical protein
MRRALILLLLLGFTGCEVWHDTFSSREKRRCLAASSLLSAINVVTTSSKKSLSINEREALRANIQILIRDRCCRWKEYCLKAVSPYWVEFEEDMDRLVDERKKQESIK